MTDSTEVWRFLEFSSCSFSFWEYSLGWYCVVALRGYFQSVCVPSSTNSGIDYNNIQIKLTYSYHSVERHYFINKLTTSYFHGVLYLTRAMTAHVYVDILLVIIFCCQTIISKQSNLLHNILSKL